MTWFFVSRIVATAWRMIFATVWRMIVGLIQCRIYLLPLTVYGIHVQYVEAHCTYAEGGAALLTKTTVVSQESLGVFPLGMFLTIV